MKMKRVVDDITLGTDDEGDDFDDADFQLLDEVIKCKEFIV